MRRQRGSDPDGVRLEPREVVDVSISDNDLPESPYVRFATTSSPATEDRHNHSLLNMTQEVQDLLQQVHDIRLKHDAKHQSPRSTIVELVDDNLTVNRHKDISTEKDEQKLMQEQQSLEMSRTEDSDDRLFSLFQLSVVGKEEEKRKSGDPSHEEQCADTLPVEQQPTAEKSLEEVINAQAKEIDKTMSKEDEGEDDSDNNAEALLQAARKERADARRWAQQLRRAVYQWVQQQKVLVQHYQQRDENHEELWQKMLELEEKLRTREDQHKKTETALRNIIREQQAKLESMQKMDKERRRSSEKNCRDERHQPLTVSRSTQGKRTAASSNSPSSVTQSSHTRSCISTEDCTIITYGNGAVKEIYKDITIIRFPNGDVQTETALERSYYFGETGVIQICHARNTNVMEYHYPNGQIEEHWQDGRKTVLYPDGLMQYFSADGTPILRDVDVSAAAVTI